MTQRRSNTDLGDVASETKLCCQRHYGFNRYEQAVSVHSVFQLAEDSLPQNTVSL